MIGVGNVRCDKVELAIFLTCYKELSPLGDCGLGRKLDFVSPRDGATERNSLVDA